MSIFSFLFPKKEETAPVIFEEHPEDWQFSPTQAAKMLAQEDGYFSPNQSCDDFSKVEQKECTKCYTRKPLTEFYKQPTNKDGLQGQCKECAKAYATNYEYQQRQKRLADHGVVLPVLDSRLIDIAVIPKMKKCSTCKKVKKSTEFQKAANEKDGLRYDCKVCSASYKKKSKQKQALQTLADEAQTLDLYNTPTKTRLEVFLEQEPSPEQQLQDLLDDADILVQRIAKLQSIVTQLRNSPNETI